MFYQILYLEEKKISHSNWDVLCDIDHTDPGVIIFFTLDRVVYFS